MSGHVDISGIDLHCLYGCERLNLATIDIIVIRHFVDFALINLFSAILLRCESICASHFGR